MIFGYDKRIVMGPECNSALYGVVALVPDKDLHEDSKGNSWTSQGSVEDLPESVQEFPEPMREDAETLQVFFFLPTSRTTQQRWTYMND
jgi:hypothetical protein